MLGSRHLYLKPQKVVLGFGFDDFIGEETEYIYLEGFAEQKSFIANKKCGIRIHKVAEDHKYNDIDNPLEKYKDEKALCYGHAMLLKPDDELIKEEFIEVDFYLKPNHFEELKYLVDKSFFSSIAEMTISLSVIGMKLGYELELDEFPQEVSLPIIGYDFLIESKDK